MSQIVKVSRTLEFVGAAQNKENIAGNPSFNKLVLADDFTQVTLDATNDYTVTVGGTNDAVAISTTPGAGGWISILPGDTDNEACFVATPLIFDISKSPVCEARLQLSDVSQTAVFFGFSDAVLETTPDMPIDYDSATLAAAATDAAGFVIDADKVTSTIYAASIATGGSVGATTCGSMATDGTNVILRVALKSDGDAEFSVNGVVKANRQAAVTDVPLCIIFGAATRDNGGGDAVFVDYLRAWQDR